MQYLAIIGLAALAAAVTALLADSEYRTWVKADGRPKTVAASAFAIVWAVASIAIVIWTAV